MLVFPVRINPVAITFQLLERDNFALDPDFDEPVGEDTFKTQTIIAEGQVNQRGGPIKRRDNTFTGDEETTDGHLVFRIGDLIDAGLAEEDPISGNISFILAKGDRVTRIASQAVNFEIIEIRTESPLRGDFLLVYITYKIGGEESTGRPR